MPRLPLTLAVTAAVASSCAGIPLPRESLKDRSALSFNGYTKPEVNCFRCHNGDGKGTLRGPNLFKVVPGKSDPEMTSAIRDGKGFMPAFKDKLSDEDVAQLIAWLRTSFSAPSAQR